MTRVLAVLIERGRARFFDVQSKFAAELPCLRTPATRGARFHSDRRDAPGRGEHAYHGRRREEQRRHLTAVASRLAALVNQDATLELALAGTAQLTGMLEALLPEPTRARVIGTLRVDPRRVTAATIARQTKQLQQAWTQLVPSQSLKPI